MIIKIKNWAEFQHYKDRCPPWIKLHKELLDNFEYQRLPLASRALAPMIWLLASENMEGAVDANHEKLAFRLRTTVEEIAAGLEPLIQAGFLIPDSDSLAKRKQVAAPETETETETESESESESESGKPHSSSSSKTVTLKQFLESCKEKAEQAIPEDDSVFAYAETVGLEREMVAVCWQEFKAAYLPKKKRYSDWRKAFNNAVRGNYYGLWFCKEGEPMSWTSKGQQARRAAA